MLRLADFCVTVVLYQSSRSMLIHLAAPNDSNGNPRRCFVLFNENGIGIAAYPEGYEGRNCLPEHLRKTIAPTINVAAQEYKSWLKIGC